MDGELGAGLPQGTYIYQGGREGGLPGDMSTACLSNDCTKDHPASLACMWPCYMPPSLATHDLALQSPRKVIKLTIKETSNTDPQSPQDMVVRAAPSIACITDIYPATAIPGDSDPLSPCHTYHDTDPLSPCHTYHDTDPLTRTPTLPRCDCNPPHTHYDYDCDTPPHTHTLRPVHIAPAACPHPWDVSHLSSGAQSPPTALRKSTTMSPSPPGPPCLGGALMDCVGGHSRHGGEEARRHLPVPMQLMEEDAGEGMT